MSPQLDSPEAGPPPLPVVFGMRGVSNGGLSRGVRLFEALVGWDGFRADVVAMVQMAKWADGGPKRAFIGGYLDERSFIFGVSGDGRLVLEMRGLSMELRRFARQFSAQ